MKHCLAKYRQIRIVSFYFIIAFFLLMMGCQSSNPSEIIAEESTDEILILTQSLDSGTIGQAYARTLTAQGGDQTYTWNVIAGVLPQGLTLDSIGGDLAGTPLVAGEYTFTVQVSDTSSLTDSKEFTLSIQANGDDDDDPDTSDCGCEPLNNVVGQAINVSSVAQLEAAVSAVNSSGGNRTILIADGTYVLNSLLHITASDVMIRSASGNRNNVVLLGKGMNGNVTHIFLIVGSRVTIADLTMGEVYYHAIQVQGENGANDLLVHNTRIFNTHEQMIKGSYSPATNQGSDNGIVRCSLLEYTENFGPQYYIGGIDIHRGANWTVQNNTFKNIRSPENGTIAEHAIHFWSNSINPLIEKNMIINCDRGIGLGLNSSGCSGGTIRNNTIYGNNSGLNSDVGIALETATNVHVYHNSIFFDYNYPNAIEYRFAASTGNIIINNLTNKAISSRNSGQATVRNNVTNAVSAWFINSAQGDLRLASSVTALIGMGETLATVTEDMDCDPRPDGEFDIGADQL